MARLLSPPSLALHAICGTSEDGKPCRLNAFVSLLIALFNLGWFIGGNAWVVVQRSTVVLNDKTSEHYCEKTAYMLSFVLLILMYEAGGPPLYKSKKKAGHSHCEICF